MTDVVIRPERPTDLAAIRAVNLAAFPGPAEANLVDELRTNGRARLSLVAVRQGRVLGHILFSPVTIESSSALGLAPMAVHPDVQRQGIGSRLVEAGLAHCRTSDVGCVVVLGHPKYYPRFGFTAAKPFGIGCEYNVPDDTFMVVELADGVLDNISGIARYAPEFAGV